MDKEYQLNVCIPCTERMYITEKCIESIRSNTSVCKTINIYCFDNNSSITPERTSFFVKLLRHNIIQYYSYDGPTSLMKCFGKAVVYQRWIDMMHMQHSLLKLNKKVVSPYQYYMMTDNDMLFAKRWDQYFISAVEKCATDFTHFATKYPGGLPGKINRKQTNHKVQNRFKQNEVFEVLNDSMTGSSGVWFMNYDMMMRTKWTPEQLFFLYDKKHGDDVNAWRIIKQKQKKGKEEYVLRVKDFDIKKPMILHLGGHIGSIINEQKRNKFEEKRFEQMERDKKFKDMSIDDIYEKYKECGKW